MKLSKGYLREVKVMQLYCNPSFQIFVVLIIALAKLGAGLFRGADRRTKRQVAWSSRQGMSAARLAARGPEMNPAQWLTRLAARLAQLRATSSRLQLTRTAPAMKAFKCFISEATASTEQRRSARPVTLHFTLSILAYLCSLVSQHKKIAVTRLGPLQDQKYTSCDEVLLGMHFRPWCAAVMVARRARRAGCQGNGTTGEATFDPPRMVMLFEKTVEKTVEEGSLVLWSCSQW